MHNGNTCSLSEYVYLWLFLVAKRTSVFTMSTIVLTDKAAVLVVLIILPDVYIFRHGKECFSQLAQSDQLQMYMLWQNIHPPATLKVPMFVDVITKSDKQPNSENHACKD